jgi:hypothetical protein
MNTTNLMKDPFYASILFQIETRILTADQKASAQGITLTDSQVRSVAHRARKAAQGASPQIPASSPRDKALAELYSDLISARTEIYVSSPESLAEPLPTADWVLSLQAVEDSIRLRSTGSGSRAYLDFLPGFLPEIK